MFGGEKVLKFSKISKGKILSFSNFQSFGITKRSFTAGEVLVVIGIILILLGILFPIVLGISERSKIVRVGLDIISLYNASLKHISDTGSIPVIPSGVTCVKVEESSFVSELQVPGWAGPYITKDQAISPFGTSYWYCPNARLDMKALDLDGACDEPFIAPFPSTVYIFAVTFPLPVGGSRRVKIAKAIDKLIDGRESPTRGNVRYPADPTAVCIGFVGGEGGSATVPTQQPQGPPPPPLP